MAFEINDESQYPRIMIGACLALPMVLYFGTHVALATQQLWHLTLPTLLRLAIIIMWTCRQAEHASGTIIANEGWTTGADGASSIGRSQS